ncbi:hypothetical protein CTAYLR_008344 [Chrysophaeum taylorii]|uniref:Endonuclease/exonuclease/phosphatase domain-containing protein n=1 Tax=Chrysophaeum taylorii TaxID=2483200 RepID=A0AAD7XLG9_9STRA|nr:hypothetical protein CTAYLR_008344 [Chrysophaeum taylorii]
MSGMRLVKRMERRRGPRPWRVLGPREVETRRRMRERSWILVSYNVLAPSLCERHAHLYGAAAAFADWEYRSPLLREELRGYGAGIVALQEVESDGLEFFASAAGLEGTVFAPRGDRPEGCAILFDAQFRLAESEALLLDAGEAKSNACAIAVLDAADDRTLVVACVHLLFNPKRSDLRLRQVAAVAAKVSDLEASHAARGRRVATLVCGDFNSYPDSPVYEFMARGAVNPDRQGDPRGPAPYTPNGHLGSGTSLLSLPPPRRGFDAVVVENPLGPLASVYADPHPSLPKHCPGEPAFTTFIDKGTKNCVDYVFYSQADLVLLGRSELLPTAFLEAAVGLPSPDAPSDHISLVAELAFSSGPAASSASTSSSSSSSSSSDVDYYSRRNITPRRRRRGATS